METKVLKEDVIRALKQVYDPEVPVNIYDLGMIYDLTISEEGEVYVKMTFTAPNCPMADFVEEDVKRAIWETPGVTGVKLEVVFDPPWDKDMMTEEALLELGMM